MPPGSLGFRASGRLTRDEYHDELMRPILAPDFHGLESGRSGRT